MAVTFASEERLLGASTSVQPSCPRSYDQCWENYHGLYIGREPSYVAIISCVLSCLGSLLLVAAFIAFRDLRTGAQKIITMLAVADFISAAGYIVASINFLVHFDKTDSESCRNFDSLCSAQATITAWSSLVSFSLTFFLAFYFYLVFVYGRQALAARLMPLYVVVSWLVPLFIIVPMAASGILGYAPYAASNWCYVSSEWNKNKLSPGISALDTVYILVAGKLWEILTYIAVIFLYSHIFIFICRRRREYATIRAGVAWQVEKRLFYIPLFFLVLRIWGTIQFFYSIGVAGQTQMRGDMHACVPHGVWVGYEVLGIIQAIGDPGQGWGNAVLYVFMSGVVRDRLLGQPCRTAIRTVGEVLIAVAGNEGNGNEARPSHSHGDREEVVVPVHQRNGRIQQLGGRGGYRRNRPANSVTADETSVITDTGAAGPGAEAGPLPENPPRDRLSPLPSTTETTSQLV